MKSERADAPSSVYLITLSASEVYKTATKTRSTPHSVNFALACLLQSEMRPQHKKHTLTRLGKFVQTGPDHLSLAHYCPFPDEIS